MNWSEFSSGTSTEYNPTISYSSIVKKDIEDITQPIKLKKLPLNDIIDIPTIININKEEKINIKKNKTKRNNYCYTCKPRGKVLKHIIEKSTMKNVMFHFDLHKRPIILVTPIKHYTNIYEIPQEEIYGLFESIRYFCNEWNIVDYQISFNNGNWQSHSHFHIKIKTNEKLINRLKKDHFKMHKLSEKYEN